MQLNKQLTVRSAAALLYNTRGIYGFYRGLWPHFLTVKSIISNENENSTQNQKNKI